MPTPNKYHGSGRLYTAKEYRDRKHAMRPTYLVADGKTHDIAANATKRTARSLGFKSLKQWDRHLER